MNTKPGCSFVPSLSVNVKLSDTVSLPSCTYRMMQTDENHSITMSEILSYLKHQDIYADSRTIRDDIETLKETGLNIIGDRKYQIENRDFELAELKLLTDCVQSSKFITERKTTDLIKKISKLCSKHEAEKIQGKVYCNRIKSMNESVHENVSAIHEAIKTENHISFKYLEYTINKEVQFRRNGKTYEVSPFALVYHEENYYLLAHEIDSYMKIKHFRVDKMKDVRVVYTQYGRRGKGMFDKIDLAEYTKQTFSMYGGGTQRVSLQFSNSLIGVVIDRFGKDIVISKVDENHFKINVPIAISNQFFSWVFAFGEDAKILEPQSVAKQYKDMLKDVFNMYSIKRS